MNIVIVDDEQIICAGMVKMVQDIRPNASVSGFTEAAEALEHLRSVPCDVIFLDIQMPEINGIEFARQIKLLQPRCNVVFVTAYSEYQGEAWKMHASGYVLKPVTRERLAEELKELRIPVPEVEKLFVRTFGNFEVFHNGIPIKFQYNKTKELFAYLIDRRGSVVTNRELISVLWGDDEIRENYYKRLRQDLLDTLRGIGQESILVRQWGGLGVNPAKIPCDYYSWLRGTADGINAYRGAYMKPYAWAEGRFAGQTEGGNSALGSDH